MLPTSSLLQSGVVLVPQFAQLNAPTVVLGLLATLLVLTLASLSFAAGEAASVGALGEGASALGSAESAGAESAPTLPAARALLYVGHPEHEDDPPVPLQRPSPGQDPVFPVGFDDLALGEAVEDAAAGAEAFCAGGGVRPRFVGRGMCRVF